MSTGKYVRNTWYAAAWSAEVADSPIRRILLDEPVVLFRGEEGRIAALVDRCPHRLAPLSRGECVDGHIRCGYHGLEFDSAGRCVNVPGQEIIPPKATVRSFPALERYGLVWLWMGDADRVDETQLPMVRKHGQPGWSVVDGGYQHHAASYRIEIENLMDPAHTTFLHKQTIGNPAARNAPVQVKRVDAPGETGIVAYRWLENTPPSPFDRQAKAFAGDQKVDRAQMFGFFLPSVSLVEIIAMPAGLEKTEDNMDTGLRTFSYKFLTPETERSTHFFWLHVRNYKVGDGEWEASLRTSLEKTYVEDMDMMADIQREQDRTGLRQIASIEIDRAPILAIREVERMIAAETAAAGPEPMPAAV